MSENRLLVDDPRLTAYALGELDPAGCAEIERFLVESPEGREAVVEIRELAGQLSTGLKAEPALELTDLQRVAIVQAAAVGAPHAIAPVEAGSKQPAPTHSEPNAGRWLRRFASVATIAAMLLVALLLVPFGQDRDLAQRERLHGVAAPIGGAWRTVAPMSRPAKPNETSLSIVGSQNLDYEAQHLALKEELGESNRYPYRTATGPSSGDGQAPAQNAAGADPAHAGADRVAAVRLRRLSVEQESLVRRAERKPSHGDLPALAGGSDTPSSESAKPADGVDFFTRPLESPSEEDQPVDAARGNGQPASRRPPQFDGRWYVAGEGQSPNAPNAAASNGTENRAERLAFGVGVTELNSDLREWKVKSPVTDRYDTTTAEAYDPIVENPFITPLAEPLSTFGVDVDTASYANIRRFLTNRQLPPRNAVRIEEMVNYFRYDDSPPPVGGRPFSVNVEVGNAPWRPEHRLVRIGLKGREIPRDKRPVSNLVFLVDVSGSMASENKLPLVKAGLSLLTGQMTESDRVAIVTYSDTAALRLDSTTGDNRRPILDTIASLQAAGSTNGAGGIQLAYETAIRHFIEGGTNRVILCTDGDFNVGVSDDDQLVRLIQERARSKVFFSVFGFGMGNLKDGKLEKLADKGNGHYAYIDSQREAKKMFVDELSGTLVTIAKDVKLQVEFNPSRVGAYRLIGYENRVLAAQDFHDDRKDAGEIGAGHSVTALYEIVPAGNAPSATAGVGLRYQRTGVNREGVLGDELLTVKLRYKQPEGDTSELFEIPAVDPARASGGGDRTGTYPRTSRDFQWASAVAAFGMILRDSQHRGQAGFDLILELAGASKGEDEGGLRQEFIDLVQMAKGIRRQ